MASIGLACPVPAQFCTGGLIAAGPGKHKMKFHGDDRQVRRCEKRYLLAQGYNQTSSHTFAPPDGGPTLIVSKRPGTVIRTGKGGEKGGAGRGRPMASAHTVVVW